MLLHRQPDADLCRARDRDLRMTDAAKPFDPGPSLSARLPLPPATVAGIVIALLAVGLMWFFTFTAQRSREEAVSRVTHTLEVIQQLGAVRTGLVNAETGKRGFLLTGEERYLEPYNEAITTLPGVLTS